MLHTLIDELAGSDLKIVMPDAPAAFHAYTEADYGRVLNELT